jgi:hypothetical protein
MVDESETMGRAEPVSAGAGGPFVRVRAEDLSLTLSMHVVHKTRGFLSNWEKSGEAEWYGHPSSIFSFQHTLSP